MSTITEVYIKTTQNSDKQLSQWEIVLEEFSYYYPDVAVQAATLRPVVDLNVAIKFVKLALRAHRIEVLELPQQLFLAIFTMSKYSVEELALLPLGCQVVNREQLLESVMSAFKCVSALVAPDQLKDIAKHDLQRVPFLGYCDSQVPAALASALEKAAKARASRSNG